MSRRKITMQKQIEILRLRHDYGLPIRRIAEAAQVSDGLVHKVLKTAADLNIKWPLDKPIDEQKWAQAYATKYAHSDPAS